MIQVNLRPVKYLFFLAPQWWLGWFINPTIRSVKYYKTVLIGIINIYELLLWEFVTYLRGHGNIFQILCERTPRILHKSWTSWCSVVTGKLWYWCFLVKTLSSKIRIFLFFLQPPQDSIIKPGLPGTFPINQKTTINLHFIVDFPASHVWFPR